MSEAWRTSLDLDGRPAMGIDWLRAAPGADVAAHRPWRAAVGPARVGTAAPGVPMRWPLAVAAWNARVGGGAMRAFRKHIQTGVPTVVLLQEVYAGGASLPEPSGNARWAARIADRPRDESRMDIVSFARETGLSLLYVPSMRNGGADGGVPEDRGCAILANVPLARPRAIELPFERQRRVAVAAGVTLGDHTIDLCSVHLDNRAPWRRAWRSLGSARTRQMAGLLKVFPSAGADASVLGGDLNTWVRGRAEGAYRLARDRFPCPETPDPRPTHHFEIGGWLRSSDHLLYRSPPDWRGDSRRFDDTFGSDHYPVVGTLGPIARD